MTHDDLADLVRGQLAVLAVAAPLALVGTQAFAQDVAFYDGNADGQPDTLIPESAWPSWATRGTGSPTVVFDRGAEEWVMLFEARLSDEFLDGTGMDWDECRPREDGPRVVWGIGRPPGATLSRQASRSSIPSMC